MSTSQTLVDEMPDDRSTSEFMKRFYRRQQAGSSKVQAMQEAMRELREEYPHPYYWAPFVLVGDGRRDS